MEIFFITYSRIYLLEIVGLVILLELVPDGTSLFKLLPYAHGTAMMATLAFISSVMSKARENLLKGGFTQIVWSIQSFSTSIRADESIYRTRDRRESKA